jgi:hypothetical protein
MHVRQQAGPEFLLEVLYDSKPVANVERPVTARAAFRNPAIRELVPPGHGFHLAKKLAALHLSIIEHFCSIRNAGVIRGH